MKRLEGVKPQLVAVVAIAASMATRPFNVSEGLRTLARQKQMVAEGKSKTMQSKHLTGDAVDLYPLTANKKEIDKFGYDILAATMKKAAEIAGVKIEWGGDWKSFVDKPHYQLC